MTFSRRETLVGALGVAGGIGAVATEALGRPDARLDAGPADAAAPGSDAWRSGTEGQRRADLGNGLYRNPVLAGDRPDPHVLQEGDDYYAVFSTFLYYPGVVIWRSRDLVNWTPVTAALKRPIGSVYALDLAKHDGRYFIYIPVVLRSPAKDGGAASQSISISVIHADRIEGPWSEPLDMGIANFIDPGHAVGEDGRRYLFLSSGHRVAISDDGLRATGAPVKVLDPWPIPDSFVIEDEAFEGPKVLRRNGWFYLFTAEGGTAGPATSHMVVVARSRSIDGPWAWSAHGPLVRTASAAEPWWSRGHATPIQGPRGDWWMAYHGYENGYRTLGRQMLLEPLEWKADNWPRALGGDLSKPLPMPSGRPGGPHGVRIGGPLHAEMLGPVLTFFAPADGYLDRARFSGGAMTLAALGTSPKDTSPITFVAGDLAYDVTVNVDVSGGAEAGLLLFYDEKLFCGASIDQAAIREYQLGTRIEWPPADPAPGKWVQLRLAYADQTATFFVRAPGSAWKKLGSYEVSGYNHNMGGGFLSLRPALFAAGSGSATFSDLTYAGRS